MRAQKLGNLLPSVLKVRPHIVGRRICRIRCSLLDNEGIQFVDRSCDHRDLVNRIYPHALVKHPIEQVCFIRANAIYLRVTDWAVRGIERFCSSFDMALGSSI